MVESFFIPHFYLVSTTYKAVNGSSGHSLGIFTVNYARVLYLPTLKMSTISTITGAVTALIYTFLLMLATDDLSLISSLHKQILTTVFITGITTGMLTFALSHILGTRKYLN